MKSKLLFILFALFMLSTPRAFALTTIGGGGPLQTGVNEYTSTDCGNPKLSTCQGGKFKSQVRAASERYVTSFQQMSGQLSSVMMKYMEIIGQLLDAKTQMQTQAQLQRLQAKAHKDYQPSDQMCRFGSFVKSVASVEESAKFNKLALNKVLMDRYTNTDKLGVGVGLKETGNDLKSRLKQFREVYCDPRDLNNGLESMCQHKIENPVVMGNEKVGGQDPARLNNDINFTRTIDTPLTLAVNFTDDTLFKTGTEEEDEIYGAEADVIALAKNLYWPEVFSRIPPDQLEREFPDYLNARHLMAVHNVAHNSFTHIVGMKSEYVPSETIVNTPNKSGSSFMKAFMREFGLSDTDIDNSLGKNPSYYAQMDVLTKKIYQSPNFYTNLYDKPANIKRINASMEAIKLMQMRDWFKTSLRREMLTSLLLEKALGPRLESVSQKLGSLEARR